MITVSLNRAVFEYDIHSLVKAFYPENDVRVRAGDREDFPDTLFHISISYNGAEGKAGNISLDFYRGNMSKPEIGMHTGGQADNPDVPFLSAKTAVDFSDRVDTKNRLKQKLYLMLSEVSEKTLPWGTLTGIRPTKIPMGMMEAGKSNDEISRFMSDVYFAAREKIDLCIEIAAREMNLLKKTDGLRGYSLYIGIPFCPSTCLYCSFTSYPAKKWETRMDDYLNALFKELDFTACACKDKYLNSVYIGGGTPTTLSAKQLERLMTKIWESFDTTHLLEVTVEAGRPDSITAEKLIALKSHGIPRISINPQSMKEETLRLIGRQHTVKDTVDSFYMARELGFNNINMDIIVGLPGEDIEDVRHTMSELEKLDPENITVHSLAVKRAARLNMQREDYKHLHIQNTWETISLTSECCRNTGLAPYYLYRQKNMAGNFENVGYAKPGYEGIYNMLIMEEKQTIIAIGAGAMTKFVSADRIERVENVKDIAGYLLRTDEMIERKRRKMEELQWY